VIGFQLQRCKRFAFRTACISAIGKKFAMEFFRGGRFSISSAVLLFKCLTRLAAAAAARRSVHKEGNMQNDKVVEKFVTLRNLLMTLA